MNVRSGAIALVLLALPASALVAAGPAVAQQGPPDGRPCGQGYTNGQPFGMRTSPKPAQGAGRQGETAVRVARGAEVVLGSRLFLQQTANGPAKPCPNERVGFYARNRGERSYRLLQDDSPTTGSDGLNYTSKLATTDFRFFGNYNINAQTNGVRTGGTLVQVR